MKRTPSQLKAEKQLQKAWDAAIERGREFEAKMKADGHKIIWVPYMPMYMVQFYKDKEDGEIKSVSTDWNSQRRQI